MATKTTTEEIVIPALRHGIVKLRVIGTTPLFQNRMAEKARQQLLVGAGRKTRAERAELKHQPYDEFRASAERLQDGPTALGLRVVAVKAAMCQAALETAGVTKSAAQRLLFMPGDHVPLYGVPQIRMDVVRCADMAKTPDIRSRCYLPVWGAEIEIQFVTPQLSLTSVATLLANAGVLIGVGDFRQEKGRGAFGSFRVIGPDDEDAEWNDLVAYHGRDAQMEALRSPEPANEETRDLLDFFSSEKKRRAA